ncbi:MAG: plastocyanin/azurin family copper-binding protein [Pseudomonadota bacterium]
MSIVVDRSNCCAVAILLGILTGAGCSHPSDDAPAPSAPADDNAASTIAPAPVDASPEAPAVDVEAAVAPPGDAAPVAGGTVHQVVAEGVKFNPMFLYVEPGDTVQWVNMAAHNVETIDAMVPDGQEKIQSELGSDVAVTFTAQGIVAYKCTPHWSTRMGGMVVVGQPEDAAATIDAYLASIDSDPSSLPAKGLLKKLKRDMDEKGLL